MAAKSEAPLPAFSSRSIAAVERATGALVSRFAEPVRQIGVRTLGFVDRMLGERVFGLVQPLVPVSEGYVYARPWYEVPRQAAAARPRAATPTAVAAVPAAARQQ